MMRLRTKILVIVAIVYNASLGYFVTLATQPYEMLLFLSFDIFLISYYLMLLVRYNYGFLKYERTHRDIIEKARQELEGST